MKTKQTTKPAEPIRRYTVAASPGTFALVACESAPHELTPPKDFRDHVGLFPVIAWKVVEYADGVSTTPVTLHFSTATVHFALKVGEDKFYLPGRGIDTESETVDALAFFLEVQHPVAGERLQAARREAREREAMETNSSF